MVVDARLAPVLAQQGEVQVPVGDRRLPPLEPGDVIAAGTPGGVGLFMDPPTFLAVGDVVEVEIDGVGMLRNRIGRG